MNKQNPGPLSRLRHIVLLVEDGLLAFTLGSMVLLAGTQILLRNVFDSGITWGDPTLRVMVLWVALLGAMVASRNGNHIRIDILTHILPGRYHHIAHRLTDLFTGMVCVLLAWHGGRFVVFEWEDGGLLFGSVPAWLCELIIPVGFAVMALRFLLGSTTAAMEAKQ